MKGAMGESKSFLWWLCCVFNPILPTCVGRAWCEKLITTAPCSSHLSPLRCPTAPAISSKARPLNQHQAPSRVPPEALFPPTFGSPSLDKVHGPILGTGGGWTTGEAAGLQTARAVVGFGWPAGTSGSAEPPLTAALPTGAADKTPPLPGGGFFLR